MICCIWKRSILFFMKVILSNKFVNGIVMHSSKATFSLNMKLHIYTFVVSKLMEIFFFFTIILKGKVQMWVTATLYLKRNVAVSKFSITLKWLVIYEFPIKIIQSQNFFLQLFSRMKTIYIEKISLKYFLDNLNNWLGCSFIFWDQKIRFGSL